MDGPLSVIILGGWDFKQDLLFLYLYALFVCK